MNQSVKPYSLIPSMVAYSAADAGYSRCILTANIQYFSPIIESCTVQMGLFTNNTYCTLRGRLKGTASAVFAIQHCF